jgi:hypothetical protein
MSFTRPVVGPGWIAICSLIVLAASGCGSAVSTPPVNTPAPSVVAKASMEESLPTPSASNSAPTTLATPLPTYGPPGKFLPAGSMAMSSSNDMATLLLDGKVLIAGGSAGADARLIGRLAEIYDPATGKFGRTGPMIQGHDGGTATLLVDGKVLIAGGYAGATTTHNFAASAGAELYDPKHGTFSRTGSMPEARYFQAAVRLLDGRVLMTGGADAATGDAVANAVLYDPTTGKFSPAGSMTEARVFQSATLLPDGRVLIIGGTTSASTAEIYDPTAGTFTATGSTRIVAEHMATLLRDGRVLVVGGLLDAGRAAIPAADLYDPATGIFTPTGSPVNECACSESWSSDGVAPLLRDGRVLVLESGGAAELYQPTAGAFTPAGAMVTDLDDYMAVELADGRVLLVGGSGPVTVGPRLSATAELYVP